MEWLSYKNEKKHEKWKCNRTSKLLHLFICPLFMFPGTDWGFSNAGDSYHTGVAIIWDRKNMKKLGVSAIEPLSYYI